jgi:hypothetical protein
MHRKTREIPVGQIVAVTVMFLAAVALLVGLSALSSPAAASSTTGSPSWVGPVSQVIEVTGAGLTS